MKLHLPSRLGLGVALAALLGAVPALARGPAPQPAPTTPPVLLKPNHPLPRLPVKPAQKQEHLGKWMDRHRNLSLPDQLHALENEPGFREYPAQTQQRMREELVKLYNMTPQQRSRILEGNEALERMTPPQRQQFNSAVQQYRALPQDRQRLVAKAFKDLRELPQGERQAIINTDRFRGQFSEPERSTLSNLLTWEPYFAAKGPNPGP